MGYDAVTDDVQPIVVKSWSQFLLQTSFFFHCGHFAEGTVSVWDGGFDSDSQ